MYCDGAYATTYGKTAHGLVRRPGRYTVAAVIDSELEGRDAGEVLDGTARGIPIVASLEDGLAAAEGTGLTPTHFVIGLAPDGGRLSPAGRESVAEAIAHGLHVDAGLHDFLTEDAELAGLAERHAVRIRDIRRPPARHLLHAFSGKIEEVTSYRVAVLGTDSAVGKRTTAWLLVDGLRDAGTSAELVGTGQTAWMQGARYGIVLDSLVNDFVAGEIEHAVWSAWKETGAQVIVLEGQGSLMNPAYPGGYELLAAGRPHAVILQHAPARSEYDGFPGYPIHPLDDQIRALELVSGRPVIAITVNHEGLDADQARQAAASIEHQTSVPTADVLLDGPGRIVDAIRAHMREATERPR